VDRFLKIEVSSTSLTLALLRRLPPERVEEFVMQASEKPAQKVTFSLCVDRHNWRTWPPF
jgi:hypothetical protein